jgi:hypothetical protein
MDIRYFIDPETGLPHIYRHGVTEEDVEDVLRRPIEDRPGREGSRVALGQADTSVCLGLVYACRRLGDVAAGGGLRAAGRLSKL